MGLGRYAIIAGLVWLSTAVSAAADLPSIRLATTTSTEQTGLLGAILPRFTAKTGYSVQVIAVGTGQSLRLAEQGDADIVLTHAPELEQAFMQAGFGVKRRLLMHNDFVLIGPQTDPLGLSKSPSVTAALIQVARQNYPFISRGDESGTHAKERQLWQQSGITPRFAQYRSVGQGMLGCLLMANELQAYTLSDRGTWLSLSAQQQRGLQIVVEGDEVLYNPYHIIIVNPKRQPINEQGAQQLHTWLLSAEGQDLINGFKINGQRIFQGDVKVTHAR